MKKFFTSIVFTTIVAMVSAFVFAGCSNDALVSADTETGRAALENTKTITSDLNPGYGKAVFFTGEFEEGKHWTVALRGEFVDGKWTCNVTSYGSHFEYKALVGDWNAGEVVEVEYPGLRKLGPAENLSAYQGMPSGFYTYDASGINYGEAVYFKHVSYPKAMRGEYRERLALDYSGVYYNIWLKIISAYPQSFFSAVAYVGSYDLGETVDPVFTNLTWEEGENHLYSEEE